MTSSIISKIIKILFTASLVFAGVALFFSFTETVVFAAGGANTGNTVNTTTTGTGKPIDVCETFGNCASSLKTYTNASSSKSAITAFLVDLSRFLVYIGVPIAIILLVVAGYKMMSSQDDGSYKKALEQLKYTLFGLVIIIIAVTIVALVTGFVSRLDLTA